MTETINGTHKIYLHCNEIAFKNNTIVSEKDVVETVPLCVVSATIYTVVNKTRCICLKFWSDGLGTTNLMYSF